MTSNLNQLFMGGGGLSLGGGTCVRRHLASEASWPAGWPGREKAAAKDATRWQKLDPVYLECDTENVLRLLGWRFHTANSNLADRIQQRFGRKLI